MILRYFLGAEAFAILGYLVGNALFPKRYSLVFYKFFGLTLYGLIVWYLSLFTGGAWTGLLSSGLGICILLALFFAIIRHKTLVLPDRTELRNFIALELISLAIFLVLVYVRTFKADVLGTEKLMDVALINAILKQGTLPIENPWLSGFLMNYYYFGHFLLALLQYIFNVPSSIGYNLAISIIGVWIVQAAYTVARSFNLKPSQSLLTALLLAFGGNLYMLVTSFFNTSAGTQWFASATRIIPYTINEFPAYSIVLGDLHGHYLSYPFFLVAIFLLVDLFFGEKSPSTFETVAKSSFLGILLGHLYLTNSWDVLTLALLGGVMAGWLLYQVYRNHDGWTLEKYGMRIAYIGLPVALFAIPQFLLSRAYYLPPVGGIGFNTQFSPIGDIFILFGQFFIIALLSFAGLWTVYKASGKRELTDSKQKITLATIFFSMAILLILIVEFVYAKDVFSTLNPPYARTNTVFKIYFHAWAFFALGSMLAFYTMMKEIQPLIEKMQWLYIIHFFAMAVFGIMVSYTYISVEQYLVPKTSSDTLERVFNPQKSDGYQYILAQHPSDYPLLQYMQTLPHSTILEIATYDSYSYNARVSAYTGHSAVSGWPLHNVQWYNGYEGKGLLMKTRQQAKIEIAQRITDIEIMYTDQSVSKISELLRKYKVDYVIFGDQERTWAQQKGKELNENVYSQICKADWEQNGAVVYNCK